MTDWQLTTPVAFLIFNRPDTTARVFEEIRRAKPPKLLVVADGPRAGKVGEDELCHQTRAIIESVDWDCEVLTNYADTNLGCKNRVSSGLDWVFATVEEAIVLEDDCLPHPTFFRYCQEMLERYRDDERIGCISGDNFLFGKVPVRNSYYFSRYIHIWGWASWRRVWQHYDVGMQHWPSFRDEGWLADLIQDRIARQYWQEVFESIYRGQIDTWDYQFAFTCWSQNALSVAPANNLISNIGFNSAATHTKNQNQWSNLPVETLAFPLQHPKFVIANQPADHYEQSNLNKIWLQKTVNSKLHGLTRKATIKK